LTARPSTPANTSAACRFVSSLPALFELGSDEILWSVEPDRDEFSNVVRGENLVDQPRDRLTHV
jgi:hypothetical protein